MVLELSRRELMQGTAVAAIGMTADKSFAWGQEKPPQQTLFAPGILGGGGFCTNIVISPDGSTRLVNTDVYGCYGFNASTGNWDQLFSGGRVPSAYNYMGSGGSGNGLSCYAVTCAPSLPTRLYAIAGISDFKGELWRSDDRGATWSQTGQTVGIHPGPQRVMGHKIAIDPNNPDVVYWGNAAGIIFRSLDAGATIYDRGPLPSLLAALVTGTTSSSSAPNTQVIHFSPTPAAVQRFRSRYFNIDLCAYDYTTPAAIGNGNSSLTLGGTGGNPTTTQVQIGSNGPAVTINAGDTIYFGAAPCICFDTTSGTTTLGGVTVTNTIFFGWGWGASAIWKTTNGGSTYSAFGTGPTSVQHMVCSSDGVFYVTDCTPTGVLAINVHNAWRYVGTTPVGSGLSANTWTNFTGITNFAGNSFHAIAADPTTPGRVATSGDSGSVNASQDYGATWFSAGLGSGTSRISTDAPYLQNTIEGWMGSGNICFDPVSSNKLWFAEGIGIWYCTCPSSNVSAVFHSQTLNNNELIFNQIVKVPGGPLIAGVQDRGILVMASPTVGPINSLPQTAIFTGFIDNGAGGGSYNGVAGNVLTVTSMISASGSIVLLNSSSGNITDANSVITSNTYITRQVSGTRGGVGVYNIGSTGGAQAVSPRTIYESFGQIKHSWCVEYAKTNPTFLVATVGNSLWKSSDSGATWLDGGFTKQNDPQISCQSPTSMVAFPIDGINPPYYTTDGVNWNLATFAGWPYNPTGGWNGNQYSNRRFVCADLVNSSKYYAYNTAITGVTAITSIANGGSGYVLNEVITTTGGGAFNQAQFKVTGVSGGVITSASIIVIGSWNPAALPSSPISQGSSSGSGTGATFNITLGMLGGLYMSSDGGVNWTRQSTTLSNNSDSGTNATLVAVPGNEGHLLYAGGSFATPLTALYRSGDGGATWHSGTNVNAAWMVACGKAKPGNSYPSVYMIGKANGDTIPGVYRSDDFTATMTGAVTWTLLTTAPAGSLDGPHTISADQDTYGTVYIGFGASGYAYGKLQ
jgi:hypothetical protein